MDIAVTNNVIARNRFGRFIESVREAAGETVREMISEGERLSRDLAPVGYKHDPRTVSLKDGMFSEMTSRTQGRWGNFARHALAIERGARPHIILGNPAMAFFWESEGRNWIPASIYYHQPGAVDVIHHPGNRAQPFLEPAYNIIKHRALDIARKHYP